MRIGLDARWIFERLSGIGIYTRELLRHLGRLPPRHEYILFFDDAARQRQVLAETGLAGRADFTPHRLAFGPFAPRGQLLLPGLLRRLALDVFHSPNFMLPFLAFPAGRAGRTRAVVTVHDLIPLLFPQYTPRALKTRFFPLFRALMREVGRRADLILTVSEASRRDILSEFRIPAARAADVVAIPNGVAPEYQPGASARPPGAENTVLYVGRFDPYKNLPGLIEAFAQLRRRRPDVRLRIVGEPDPRYPEAPRRARELGLDGAIDWAGYAAGAQLVQAYRDADVFVLPSLYEGFGLTVVEAMACGTPVVCSDRSSLPEVAGDAALCCDPQDPAALAAALERVLGEPALAAQLRARGLERARRFTWARTAELTQRAYETLAP